MTEPEKNPIASILDENDSDPVELYDEEDNPIMFDQIAVIPYGGGLYCILKPKEPMEGVGEDEAIVFEIRVDEDDEGEVVVEENDDIIDGVFKEYYILLEESGKP